MRAVVVISILASLGCRPAEVLRGASPPAPPSTSPRELERPSVRDADAPPASSVASSQSEPSDPTGTAVLSGSWSGTYLYATNDRAAGAVESVGFFAELQLDHNLVRGSITERNTFDDDAGDPLRSSIVGVIDRDGMVRFEKRYDGPAAPSHVVEYVGRLDFAAARIEGTWSTPSNSGRFVMKRERPLPQVARAAWVPMLEVPGPRSPLAGGSEVLLGDPCVEFP